MKPLLDSLERLAIEHFKYENKVLNKINNGPLPLVKHRLIFLRAMVDAAIDDHITNHILSLNRLKQITWTAEPTKKLHYREISVELKDWFVEHALKHDAHLKPIFAALSSLH